MKAKRNVGLRSFVTLASNLDKQKAPAKRKKIEAGDVIKLNPKHKDSLEYQFAKVMSCDASRICFRGRRGRTGQFVKAETIMSRRKFNSIKDSAEA